MMPAIQVSALSLLLCAGGAVGQVRDPTIDLGARPEFLVNDMRDGALKTRYHGDYHLGQVLLSKNDFVIIDFEGEPTRPVAERRAKQSPLRDVAGMLRSFNYARWTAWRHAVQSNEDTGRVEPLVADWERQVRREFLEAYDVASGGSGLYASFEAARGLLDLFEMEKALYEVRYELANRPGWVGIPLQGILSLAGLA